MTELNRTMPGKTFCPNLLSRTNLILLGEGNGHPHQYSYLGNPMGRGAWQTTVHGVMELDMTE